MGVQEVIVALIFAAALFYVGKSFYRSLRAKSGCKESCKCGVDFSKIDVPEKS
jgi:hypothetical protein